MNSLEDYFTNEEAEILPDCEILKKIDNETNPYIESDENGEYDLSRKHLLIRSGHRAPWANNNIEWDEKEFFSNFVSLDKNDLTLPNLKKLEGTFILLEWNGWFDGFYVHCSHISFMRVYKEKDEKFDSNDEGIYVCEAKHKHLYDVPVMYYKQSNDLYQYLTINKLTELQNYSNHDGKTIWSYRWKIWIPSDCYERLFKKDYKMCLSRRLDRDITNKICLFI